MEKFPFVFLNHGKIDLDYVNKNTECYIWFEREVTPAQRKFIIEACPPPLSGLFVWGECFAYFGSGGDTYDFDIIESYAGREICQKFSKILQEEEFDEDEMEEYQPYIEDRSVAFPEIKIKSIDFSDFDSAFGDLLKICVPRMVDDLNNWALKIHNIVPIAFIKGPHGVEDGDEWNTWSYKNLDIALNFIISYVEQRKETLLSDIPAEEAQQFNWDKSVDDGQYDIENSYDINILPESERIRYFGYIFNDVLSKYSAQAEGISINGEERKKRLNLADIIYNLDDIKSSFDRLSIEEHNIHTNSHIISSTLFELTAEERIKEIEKLKPYTRLAYYASYGALKSKDILSHENPEVLLEQLINIIPSYRDKAISSILSMIAHNLVKVTPAYQKHDNTYAKEASKIFKLLCNRDDATEKDFITATVCCEWAGNPKLGVEISEIGLKKFPKSKQLLHNAVSVNNLTNNHERSNQLLSVYESVQQIPDENFILNKSFNLIKSNKLGEAKNLLEKYIEQGGKKTPNVLVNLFYTWWMFESPEKSKIAPFVSETIELIKNKTEYQAENLLENFMGFASAKEYKAETIELGDFLFGKLGNLPPNCWVNYTYAAYFLNEDIHEKAVARIDALLPNYETHFSSNSTTFGNIAAIYTKLNNIDKTIEYLKLCKKYDSQKFQTFKTDDDFKPFWNEKRFIELFN